MKILNINEISDSREVLESKPGHFISIGILILFVLLLSAIVWSYFGEIDIVTKSEGVVRPNEAIGTVKNKVLGNIEKVYFENGKYVKKGELLYVISYQDLKVEKVGYQEQLQFLNKELDYLHMLYKSVEDNKSYFNLKDNNQIKYHERFLKYKTEYQKIQVDSQASLVELDVEIQKGNTNKIALERKISEMEKELDGMEKLKKSVISGRDLLSVDETGYSNDYTSYVVKRKKLENVIENKRRKYEISKSLGKEIIPNQTIEDERQELIAAEIELQNYYNNYLLEVVNKIKSKKAELLELKDEAKKIPMYEPVYESNKLRGDADLKKYHTAFKVEVGNEIKITEEKIKETNEKIKIINTSIEDRKVKAPIDGIVNVINDVKRGDLLQTGVEILTVIPKNNSKYTVQISVPNKDIANISVGNKIKYHFLALPYKEYGELFGTIEKIGTDAIINPETGQSYYMVEANIQNKTLYSYKGKEAYIKVGMVCEANVITNRKKILYFLLEKLNLKD